MLRLVLSLLIESFLVSLFACGAVLLISRRLGALDTEPIAGQVKAERRPVPNTGGIGIAIGVFLPLVGSLGLLSLHEAGALDLAPLLGPALAGFLPGMIERLGDAWILVAAAVALHVMGVVDDRRPLGPGVKLGAMILAAAATAWLTDTRLLELLDAHVGGPWLSIAVTIIWFVAVTNAFNFIDNMDGLSAGVAAIVGGCLIATSMLAGQLFVPALLALVVGSACGFLIFNFPPARMFMGDGGSLVLGFLLAFATVRATYLPEPAAQLEPGWFEPHALFTPLIMLAIPLYDLVSVVTIRIRQGRSPFVGDLQHFSHRLVDRGLSRRSAVLVIYGLTLVTALGGVAMPRLEVWHAALVFMQTVCVLLVLAMLERSTRGAKP